MAREPEIKKNSKFTPLSVVLARVGAVLVPINGAISPVHRHDQGRWPSLATSAILPGGGCPMLRPLPRHRCGLKAHLPFPAVIFVAV